MANTRRFISGVAVGAALAYVLDRDRGRRRRALMRDRLVHSQHVLSDAVQTAQRDVRHRAVGFLSRRARPRHEPIPDHVLAARVRAHVGRIVSHPRAVDVTVRDGQVTLRGPILSVEAPRLVNHVRNIPGVNEVVDELESHERAGNISALQGISIRPGERFEFFQEHWSPAARAVGIVTGGLLAAAGGRRGGLTGAMTGAVGLMLTVRGLTNMTVRRFLGASRDPEGFALRKTINVDAPMETVFELWADPLIYPLFMEHVREIRKNPDRSYHWVVAGPANIPVEWDAMVTRQVPNQELSWRSVPGTTVPQAGPRDSLAIPTRVRALMSG